MDFIESTRFIDDVEVTITTGDVEYPGNAMEVCEQNGNELFHIVVDSTGQKQVIFLAHKGHYRLSLPKIEEILEKANECISIIYEDENSE